MLVFNTAGNISGNNVIIWTLIDVYYTIYPMMSEGQDVNNQEPWRMVLRAIAERAELPPLTTGEEIALLEQDVADGKLSPEQAADFWLGVEYE